MKTVFFGLVLMLSANAFATVDAMTSGWIVVQNVQDDEDFGVQQVPIIGCYGLPQGPQLEQFVKEFKVAATIGCGWSGTEMQDINALSCAKIVESLESPDYGSFKKIVLDISKCAYKENKKFITMVRTAAARNFPQTKNGKPAPTEEVELVLVK